MRGALQAITKQLESTSLSLAKILESPDFNIEDYGPELAKLQTIEDTCVSIKWKSITAGCVTFLAFRRAPQTWIQQINMQRRKLFQNYGNGNRYQLDRPVFQNRIKQQQQGPTAHAAFQLGIQITMRLGVEAFVSVLVAASTSVYLLHHAKLGEEIASIPLVEGRSLVSHEICTILQSEMTAKGTDDDDDDDDDETQHLWKTTDNTYMKNVIQFVTNCQREQAPTNKYYVTRRDLDRMHSYPFLMVEYRLTLMSSATPTMIALKRINNTIRMALKSRNIPSP